MLTQHNMTDDSALIQAYISGDNDSMSKLMDRYKKKIYKYILLTVKNDSVADDIFQDLFIKIQKSLKSDRYIDNGKFLSWTLRIAHNLIIDYFRQKKQSNLVSTDDDGQSNIMYSQSLLESNIEDKLVDDQIKTDLRRLVDSLPVEQREVVILRHYLGMSFKDIATHTDVSINTALGRMRYALINLRKMIEDNNMYMDLKNYS
ncbi:MAG: sigma-70 family RNA polymerase sigma factor [Rikenellaceae bacterium]